MTFWNIPGSLWFLVLQVISRHLSYCIFWDEVSPGLLSTLIANMLLLSTRYKLEQLFLSQVHPSIERSWIKVQDKGTTRASLVDSDSKEPVIFDLVSLAVMDTLVLDVPSSCPLMWFLDSRQDDQESIFESPLEFFQSWWLWEKEITERKEEEKESQRGKKVWEKESQKGKKGMTLSCQTLKHTVRNERRAFQFTVAAEPLSLFFLSSFFLSSACSFFLSFPFSIPLIRSLFLHHFFSSSLSSFPFSLVPHSSFLERNALAREPVLKGKLQGERKATRYREKLGKKERKVRKEREKCWRREKRSERKKMSEEERKRGRRLEELGCEGKEDRKRVSPGERGDGDPSLGA